jgi:tetraacyldisaccharide 4'-kinase
MKSVKIFQSLFFILIPFSYLYSILMVMHRGIQRLKRREGERGNAKVVSVGNLSVGGTGKTPFVIYLARMFSKRGKKVAVVSRGYGRNSRERIIDLQRSSPQVDVGEEPSLMSLKTGLPIIVAKDKREGIDYSIEKYSPDIVILDDGFQSFSVERDIDIVLLDATDDPRDMFLLPAGRYREPFGSISRADIVVITKCKQTSRENVKRIVRRVRKYLPTSPLFSSSHVPVGFFEVAQKKKIPLSEIKKRRILSVSSLAKNHSFVSTLNGLGVNVVHSLFFPDHHRYSAREISLMNRLISSHSIGTIVTTEKDRYSILPYLDDLNAPLLSLQIEVSVEREDDLITSFLESGLL